jgi:hypothetical protein
MKFKIIILALITIGPKLIALLRDVIVIKHYGLGVETATLTTILYTSQFIANVVMPGVQALFLSGNGDKNQKFFYFKIIEMGMIAFYIIYLIIYFNGEIIPKKIEIIFMLAICMYTTLEMNKQIFRYTISTSQKSSVIPYAADMVMNIGIIIYLIIFTFNANSFLVVLIAGNIITGIIYYYNSPKKIMSNSVGKMYHTYFGAVVLTLIMSITNIFDQTILGNKSEIELSLFNIIQRYTFVIAGIFLIVSYRHLGSRVFDIKFNDVKVLIKKYYMHFLLIYVFMFALAFNSDNFIINNFRYDSVVYSLLQIPLYVIYAFLVSIFIGQIGILDKIFIGCISLISKYLFIFTFGVTINNVFISHFILNLVGGIMILIILSKNKI